MVFSRLYFIYWEVQQWKSVRSFAVWGHAYAWGYKNCLFHTAAGCSISGGGMEISDCLLTTIYE